MWVVKYCLPVTTTKFRIYNIAYGFSIDIGVLNPFPGFELPIVSASEICLDTLVSIISFRSQKLKAQYKGPNTQYQIKNWRFETVVKQCFNIIVLLARWAARTINRV